MAKTTITKTWEIGTWEQRSLLNYVPICKPIDGKKCENCIDSNAEPYQSEYDPATGILYEKYKDGVSAIVRTVIEEA